MGRFAEYQTDRKIKQLASVCDAKGISLQPLVDECYRLMGRGDLTEQEVYNELLKGVGNFIGNMATGGANLLGKGVGLMRQGAGAMANSFGQGYTQGAGQQQAPANGQQAVNGQQQAVNGQQAANGQQQKQQGPASGGNTTQQLQQVQQMLKKMGSDHQQIGGLVDQLTKAIQQPAPAAAGTVKGT